MLSIPPSILLRHLHKRSFDNRGYAPWAAESSVQHRTRPTGERNSSWETQASLPLWHTATPPGGKDVSDTHKPPPTLATDLVSSHRKPPTEHGFHFPYWTHQEQIDSRRCLKLEGWLRHLRDMLTLRIAVMGVTGVSIEIKLMSLLNRNLEPWNDLIFMIPERVYGGMPLHIILKSLPCFSGVRLIFSQMGLWTQIPGFQSPPPT